MPTQVRPCAAQAPPATSVLLGPTRQTPAVPRPTWPETQAMLQRHTPAVPLRRRATVRAFDITVSLLALIVMSPVMVALALLTVCSSPGPAVFVHWRVGRGGELFPCLKFRSMYSDAESRLELALEADREAREDWLARHKIRNDPRVTSLGRLLRRTNLDELPQLANVLRGQMSIVGPRPIVTDETTRFGESLPTVLSVKPGLTGLWQVSGRNDLTYLERVRFDVEYVERRSIPKDLVICLRTAWLMLRPGASGAY